MKEIKTVKEGVVRFFEEKHETLPAYELLDGKRYQTIKWEGKSAPLFSFREHPKIHGMIGRRDDLFGKPCALTAYSVDNATLDTLLFRELVIAELCFKSEVVKVTAFVNGPSANVLVKLANDGTYHVTLHAASFGESHFKHELFSEGGMISNRAVDSVIDQKALNIFTEKGGYEYITDNHYILYGLNPEEVNEVVAIYATMMHEDTDELNARAARIDKIVDVALSSSGKCVIKGEDF